MTLEGEAGRGINGGTLPEREELGSQIVGPASPIEAIRNFLDEIRTQIGAQRPKKRIPQGWH